jgi:hypothetical protein
VASWARHVDAIAGQVAREPLRAGFVGFLGETLFVPLLLTTVVVLTVSVIGIPLLALMPFAVVLLLVVLLVGFTGVAAQVGRVTGDRFNLSVGPHASVAIILVWLSSRRRGNGFSSPAVPAHDVAQATPEMPPSPPAATPGGDVL